MRVQDLRHAVRVLWKSRAFSLAAIVTLALGIGVNTAVFILYDAALYESLPATRPSELYRVITWAQQGGDHFDFSYPLYVDLRDAPGAHDGLAAYTTDSVAVAAAGHSERVIVEYVTANYFDVLGINPSAGPGFSAATSWPAQRRLRCFPTRSGGGLSGPPLRRWAGLST